MIKNKRNLDHLSTPLCSALENMKSKKCFSFHVPGHKNGRLIPKKSSELIGNKVFQNDKTEISGLDNLHNPSGVIKDSQELLTDAYSVSKSYFLVGGSTAGIEAMILESISQGEKIIVGRDCHKSAISGIILSGAEPVFVDVFENTNKGFLNPVSFVEIKKTIDQNIDAKAILLTSPTYFGLTSDIEKISAYAKKLAIKVLVDEAHGAHFNFSRFLPKSATKTGADIVVQSAHKTLPALTGGSFLHVVNDNSVNISRLEQVLQMVQTSSPSYPIMASLDACRKFMAFNGDKLLKKTIRLSRWLRYEINKIDGLKTYRKKEIISPEVFDVDETKVFIDVSDTGLTGFQAQDLLAESGIYVELATFSKILLVLSVASNLSDAKFLIKTLKKISEMNIFETGKQDQNFPTIPRKPEKSMNPRNAFFSKRKVINLNDAVGMTSADTITVYPPGIPIVIPGEIFSGEIVGYINTTIEAGGTTTGIRNHEISVVE
ncbi:MAG: aminotransferase class I/II-fold pyridoxal phosphate-dependent enzyme [Caldisericia bacterium]